MKLLVLSDSHGDLQNMMLAVRREAPDQIAHLGDCWRDAAALHAHFPGIPLLQVPGNCDREGLAPPEQLVTLEGCRILLCHGHTYGVKSSLLGAGYAAEEQKLDVFLFGHTHRPFLDQRNGTLFLNPGSIGLAFPPSYGILLFGPDGPSGRILYLDSK